MVIFLFHGYWEDLWANIAVILLLMVEVVHFFYIVLTILKLFSSPNFRLGGTISAYKIVPDEIEEIKV